MSPGAEFITRICADTTPQMRTDALHAAAEAMPHIHETFSEMDYFRLSAFSLWFIAQGRLPTNADYDTFADFINGTEKPKAEH